MCIHWQWHDKATVLLEQNTPQARVLAASPADMSTGHILTLVPISVILLLQGSSAEEPQRSMWFNSLCAQWGQEPVERKRTGL